MPNHTFDIIVTYNDLGIAKEKKTFSFEFGNLDNTDQFGSPHTDDVANACRKSLRKFRSVDKPSRWTGQNEPDPTTI